MEHSFKRSIEFTIAGTKNSPDILIQATEVNGDIVFDVNVLESNKQSSELRGLFFNLNYKDKLDDVIISGLNVTDYEKDNISNLGKGSNVRGNSKNKNVESSTYDIGIEFGTPGNAKDFIDTTSFTLSNLTLDDIANVDFAARLSASSSKLSVVAPAAPDAKDDVYDIYEDSSSGLDDPSTVPIASYFEFTSNDTDADGDTLTIVDFHGVSHGTVERIDNDGDGSFEGINYTPDKDFSGIETFYYSISDNNGGTDFAHVTINIEAVADIPDLSYEILKDVEDSSVNEIIVRVTATQTDADGSEFIDRILLDGIPADVLVSEEFYNPIDEPNQIVKAFTLTLPKGYDNYFDLGITAVSKETSNGDEEIATDTVSIEYDTTFNDLSTTFKAKDQGMWSTGNEDKFEHHKFFGLGEPDNKVSGSGTGIDEGKELGSQAGLVVNTIHEVDVKKALESDANAYFFVRGNVTLGDLELGDKISLTVNNKNYETTIDADGNWRVDVLASDLNADKDFTVTATGNVLIDKPFTVTSNMTGDTNVTLDVINQDDIDNALANNANVLVSGSTTGSLKEGNTVSFTVNEKYYETTVQADRSWSVNVLASDLELDKDFLVTATGSINTNTPIKNSVEASVTPTDATESSSGGSIDLGIASAYAKFDMDYAFGFQSDLVVSGGNVNATAPYSVDLNSYYNKNTDWLRFESDAFVKLDESVFDTQSPYLDYKLELLAQLSGNVEFGVGVDIGGVNMPWPFPDIPGYENDWSTEVDIPEIDLAIPLVEFNASSGSNTLNILGMEGDGELRVSIDKKGKPEIEVGGEKEEGGNEILFLDLNLPDIKTESKLNEAEDALISEGKDKLLSLGIDVDQLIATMAGLPINPFGDNVEMGIVSMYYDLVDYRMMGTMSIGQDFEMNFGEIDGTIIFEDDSEHSFTLGDDFDIHDISSKDVDSNGTIEYEVKLDPSAIFQSNLNLVLSLDHHFKALEVGIDIDVPLFEDPKFALGPVYDSGQTPIYELPTIKITGSEFDFDLGSANYHLVA